MASSTGKQPKTDDNQQNESNQIFKCPFKMPTSLSSPGSEKNFFSPSCGSSNLQSNLLASSKVSSDVRSKLLISNARPFEEVVMETHSDEQSEPYPKPKDSVLSMTTKN
ncbi:unnamed protein product [Rotaria magnacalcarata]|uniref:Uncharacterized protein n=2 Tax=Rotaria magnacalcarata TaxID=392030 RepID=A0A815X530_9BILA|nr:unnamed protein product [Rotaria magnacalcarata]CAF1613767.1 unnamed protein product [Rotaria magnacalcarata]